MENDGEELSEEPEIHQDDTDDEELPTEQQPSIVQQAEGAELSEGPEASQVLNEGVESDRQAYEEFEEDETPFQFEDEQFAKPGKVRQQKTRSESRESNRAYP